MFLRSDAKKPLLFSKVSGSSPIGDQFSTPRATVREQREEQEGKKNRAKMIETVEALSQCCATSRAKVERIRRAVEAAGGDHRKFSIHALRLYAKNVDSAYAEFNDFQNRIYLTDPARKGEFEPNFIDFEELYELTSIVICEMLQCYEDEEKALAMAAANSMPKTGDDNCQLGGSGTAHVIFPSTIVLQQTALPTFDGRYEN